ncbi:MAG TPA: ATPase domain-containing protein [Verrucomicrobiae bacterium]|nr:ATPase domain-containing protein [Verrucomicrobiae bacterium]
MITINTGCKCIDTNIGGGISPESVTLIYGEPETGKTTLAIQCTVSCALQNYKTLFVDCDNTFSTERLSQLSADKFDQVAEQVILVKPKDFHEQMAVIDCIQDYTEKNFGLIVIDTFTSLYGAKVAESSGKAFSVNRELNRQLAILAQTAKIRKIPVIIVSQVRSVFDNPNVSIAPVANRVLKFWADTIIAMKPTEYPQTIKAVLETRDNKQEVTCYVQIGETGIKDTEFRE